MRSEIAVNVAATPHTVFDLVRDIERWPRLLPHYRRVTVHSRVDGHVTATMSAIRPVWKLGIPVRWRTEQWADDHDADDLMLRFVHLAGATRGMDVIWHIRRASFGARVSIEHRFRRSLPLLGDAVFPRVVDRLFVRAIAGRTLATFKALAETEAR